MVTIGRAIECAALLWVTIPYPHFAASIGSPSESTLKGIGITEELLRKIVCRDTILRVTKAPNEFCIATFKFFIQ
jgi:hypothetical protein